MIEVKPDRLRDKCTDRQTDRRGGWAGVCRGGVYAGAVKPGQRRTRVMLSHSSHTARLDPGKDRGRREQEQGSRGEARWGGLGRVGLLAG